MVEPIRMKFFWWTVLTKWTSVEVHQEYCPRVLTKSIDKEYWPRVLAENTSHISTMAGPMRLKFFLVDCLDKMVKFRCSSRVLTKSTDQEYWPKVLAESTSYISTMVEPIRMNFFWWTVLTKWTSVEVHQEY